MLPVIVYVEIYKEPCTLLWFLFLICLICLFKKKIAGWDPVYWFYCLLVDCSEQFENIALAKLSHLLWEDESKSLMWVVMTQNNTLLILARGRGACSLCAYPTPKSARHAALTCPGSGVCSSTQGRGFLGKWTYMMIGWNPFQSVIWNNLSFHLKTWFKKSGLMRNLKKIAQMTYPDGVIFIQPPQHEASLLIWQFMVLLHFHSSFPYSLSSISLSSLFGASVRWKPNNPLCLLWIMVSKTLLLLNLISYVIF